MTFPASASARRIARQSVVREHPNTFATAFGEASGSASIFRAANVIVANPFFPGWHAMVDGHDTPLDLSPGDPMALAVPAGRHRIRIDYRPRSFQLGIGVMIASALAVLALRLRQVAPSFGARHQADG